MFLTQAPGNRRKVGGKSLIVCEKFREEAETGSWETRSWELGAGSWELGAGSWELGARSWELGAGS
jgi:hypothetical protein